ncbi:GRB10-interacting GYF protein 2 [Brachypodium distachyon]|uniref:GRB10-interacting GYF protein 2 n=1 Tax=Brachypodium distachyon TaxID=15368 RepID=UPI000234F00B|nr:GRB10-interacting GYF protein 2 [Brachypodium distachyon]|eukprot:XP_003580910.1 GRB10-interacting GYF protein 2 [Brachypodium distachyon]
MEPSRPPFSFAASSSIRIMEPPLLQESEQPQPCPPSAANSLRPIPSEGRRLVELPLPSMDAVEEETMNVEQQVAPTDEHQTVQTTPEGEGCVQLPQISKKRLRKEEKAKNLEEKRRKKQQEKRRKLEDKKEKEKKLQQKKNKDGTSPSAMHCSKEVRSPICRSPGVNMIRALKRRNSAALGRRSNKSSSSHILDETPKAQQNPCLQYMRQPVWKPCARLEVMYAQHPSQQINPSK